MSEDLEQRIQELEQTVDLLLLHALDQHEAKGYCHSEGQTIQELRDTWRRKAALA